LERIMAESYSKEGDKNQVDVDDADLLPKLS
jgi:hypothetical protein